MIIALDFDGTCVTHEYPNIGQPIPWCLTTLQALIANGHQIVLNTMRSGPELHEAVTWFIENGIPSDAVHCPILLITVNNFLS